MNIELRHEEGLQFLATIPNNSVDLILTDPPYEISRATGFIKSSGEKTIERFKMSYEFGGGTSALLILCPLFPSFIVCCVRAAQ